MDRQALPVDDTAPLEIQAQNWDCNTHILPDGWPLRWAFWRMSLPKDEVKGYVLLQPGRPEPLELYAPVAAKWAQMGYQAVVFDRRGRGGSGRVVDTQPMLDHISSFDVYLNDLKDFCTKVYRPFMQAGKPSYIMGHSTGAHLALRYVASQQGLFDAAIVTSPLAGLDIGHVPQPVVHLAAKLFNALCAPRFAFGQKPFDPNKVFVADNEFTSDETSWEQRQQFLRHHPELQIGGVSPGWVNAALTSCGQLLEDASKISIPVLAHLTPDDRVVSGLAQKQLWAQLPPNPLNHSYDYVGFGHELLAETPLVREKLWSRTHSFIQSLQPV